MIIYIVTFIIIIHFKNYNNVKKNNKYYKELEFNTTKGLGLGNKYDFPTINLLENKTINPGVYNCNTDIGKGILFIDSYHTGELHIINKKIIYTQNKIKIYDIRLINFNNVQTGLMGMFLKAIKT
jgi:FAD synthase